MAYYEDNLMRAGRLPSLLIATVCLMAIACLGTKAHAQTIQTPAGELRVGMSEGDVTHLLQRPVQERKIDGIVTGRSVFRTFDNRTFIASLTSKGFVYSVFSKEWFPSGSTGQKAAILMFRNDLEEYSVPTVDQEQDVTSRFWKTSQGLDIEIGLHCDATVLIVGVNDYERQFADDGVRDDRLERMDPSPDTWCF